MTDLREVLTQMAVLTETLAMETMEARWADLPRGDRREALAKLRAAYYRIEFVLEAWGSIRDERVGER